MEIPVLEEVDENIKSEEFKKEDMSSCSDKSNNRGGDYAEWKNIDEEDKWEIFILEIKVESEYADKH